MRIKNWKGEVIDVGRCRVQTKVGAERKEMKNKG